MTQLVRVGTNGTAPGRALWFWCPGCDDAHRITVDHPDGWTWDGNEQAPTISPSILTWRDWGDKRRCHSFIRAGRWEFLTDSTHALAGQTVPMVPLPDWLTDEYVGGPS